MDKRMLISAKLSKKRLQPETHCHNDNQ